MEEEFVLFYRFGVALFIGMLVGLQREYTYDEEKEPDHRTFAGVRTFALLGLAGCMAAFVADLLNSSWVFTATVLLLGAMITVAYLVSSWRGPSGMTTEVAAVITILIGALAYWNELAVAVAIGVAMTALLSFKLELHQFVEKISREDMVAMLKFAIITAIILPVLPDEAFFEPPFDVLNPYKIWLMVVLISGIGFLGYILVKIVGSRQGIGLTGLLGGLVSSTAVTLTFAQRSQQESHLARPFALAITIAWTVMFIRVLVEIAVTNLALLQVTWLPIVVSGGAGLAYGLYLYFSDRTDEKGSVTAAKNPFELGPAIQFGLLYGLILLVARAAQFYFGDTGIYISSVLSGLADVDAITLSMSELSNTGTITLPTAARAIVLAVMSNTAVKGGIVLSGGTMALRRAFLPGFILMLASGIGLSFLL